MRSWRRATVLFLLGPALAAAAAAWTAGPAPAAPRPVHGPRCPGR